MFLKQRLFSFICKANKYEQAVNPQKISSKMFNGSNQPLINEHTVHLYNFKENEALTLYQKFRRLFNWGPIIALLIIIYIFSLTLHCLLLRSKINLYNFWTSYNRNYSFLFFSDLIYNFVKIRPLNLVHISVYLLQLYLVLSNFLSACFLGAGFVPYNWRPANNLDAQFLQFCNLCNGFKPPRAHHCKKCDRCVLKMDHHCPWINSCCGHNNHGFFIRFLFYAPIGCLHSLVILFGSVWSVISLLFFSSASDEEAHSLYNMEPILTGLVEFIAVFFGLGLALGVIIAVGMLFFVQLFSIAKNETGIENYIASKARIRRQELESNSSDINLPPYVNPYRLSSCWENIRQVLTLNGHCVGNGFDWNVNENCCRFDMTVEQLKQKRDKQINSRSYVVVAEYSGRCFPFREHGLKVACAFPLVDESRLALKVGETVQVTRWRKSWYYGQLMSSTSRASDPKDLYRLRGWFPRACVLEEIICRKSSKSTVNGKSEPKPDISINKKHN